MIDGARYSSSRGLHRATSVAPSKIDAIPGLRPAWIRTPHSMKLFSVLVMIVPFLACIDVSASDTITVAGELARMRTADHLFRPQSHRLLQYSGFHREGGNPDRYFCLYEEDGWRVVADHKGPGVVSRIWTTHDTSWREIRIEVDGETIFEDRADRFFSQDKLPFITPLSEIRNSVSGRVTAEKETAGRKEWAVSYVPIPFKKRFRYMQRDKLYANINIKAYSPDVEVESFLDADWTALKPEFDKTAAVWERMDLFGEEQPSCKRIEKSLTLSAASSGTKEISNVIELPGPGILRGIRIRTKEPQQIHDVELLIRWDDEEEFSIVAPLDHGFGSRKRRTLAIGQSVDGWRALCLPMPFREKASIKLASRSAEPVPCDLELLVDDETDLPDDVLYLWSCSNEGRIAKGAEFAKPDLPLTDFFYHNGYTAFERVGAGHIVAYMDLFDCQPELDEHVFLDDERTFPENSWNGTGHEDLFDMAWGHKPVSAPMTSGGSQDFEEVNVKLFWNDPMTFRTAIRFNWEWAFRFGVRPPRNARFASVVYWYGNP